MGEDRESASENCDVNEEEGVEQTDKKTTEDKLYDDMKVFIKKEFPQIQMHGGAARILEVDDDSGKVTIELSGACSGCGISPMTTQALHRRVRENFQEIEEVTIEFDSGMSQGPMF